MKLSGNIVYPVEYDILVSMDLAFCEETNKEIRSRREIQEERMKREAELNKGRKRR